jgi:hypothetical protein
MHHARVLSPLNHDGRFYQEGDPIDLPADLHAELAAAGVVSLEEEVHEASKKRK